ncbi:MAG: hypothetical protein AAGI38_04050 [Bacteroidota bacterium]
MIRTLFLCLLLSISAVTFYGQTQTVFPSQFLLQGSLSIYDLWRINLFNQSSNNQLVFLEVTVTNSASQVVYAGRSSNVMLPGSGSVNLTHLNIAPITITNDGSAGPYVVNGLFVAGSYEVCLKVMVVEGREAANSCMPVSVMQINPPNLVFPFDKDTLAISYPMFTWTPMFPIGSAQSVGYNLKIYELQNGQTPLAAVQLNPAFYVQNNVLSTVHPYPINAPQFDSTKAYVWQVEGMINNGSIGKSPVWEFCFAQDSIPDTLDSDISCVELQRVPRGTIYLAREEICFRFDARYSEQVGPSNYRIFNEQNREVATNSNALSKISANTYRLELPFGTGFVEENYYVLEVSNELGEVFQLKFTYLKKDK